MDHQELIARKISEAVISSGISKVEISERIGVSRPTLDAYIKGQSVIDSDKLALLASCTGRSMDYFFNEDVDTKIFFRATHIENIPQKYHVEAEERLRKYAQLENLLEDACRYLSLEMPINEYDEDEIQKIANKTRLALGLSSESIISDVFEVIGQFAKVIRLEIEENSISGFSAHSDIWGGAIFLNKRNTLERQIFTAVHEMAHLIMHRKYYKKDLEQKEYKNIEKIADYFTGVFLVPFDALKRAYDELGEKVSWEEFLELKLKFRVSALALLYRFYQENLISKRLFDLTYKGLKKEYGKDEPERCLKENDFYSLVNDRFNIMLKRGFSNKHLSPSKLAELAGVSQKIIREWIRKWIAEKDLASGASER